MRLRPFIGALALCVFAAPGAHALEQHTWRDRVVVVFAARDNATVAEQRTHTKQAEEALAERDMSVVAVVADKVEHWFGEERGDSDPAAIRARFKVPADQAFLVLLVGKDGEVKWRTEKPTDLEDAIALVDTMPMRQREKGEGG